VRVLFDARSVRTPTGRYVLTGLASAWGRDARVGGVFAAVPQGAESQLPADIAVVPLPANEPWLKHVTSTLVRVADRVRADVIFCANGTGPRDGRTVLYFQDLFHFRYRDSGLSLKTRLFEAGRARWRALSASRSGLGIAVSQTIAEEAREDVRGLPIVEIPNGVEVDSIRWRGEDDVVFVSGGSGSRKGEETAVRAWARLGGEASRSVLEIGGVDPAGRRNELQRLVNDLELAKVVRIHGPVPRSAYLERIASARLTLSCSRLESFGLPVAEALAIGAPLLCTNLPAHRELLARAGAGESFPTGDDAALAIRLGRALAGEMPRRLASPPVGWDWTARGREHIDAYQEYLHA
jgi:glycosyltransferase involved in cell wall biosynthesis